MTGMHTKVDDAARKLIHYHEHPVGLEQNGLATKQIDTPKTVLQMADKRQPGRAVTGVGSRSVVLGEYTLAFRHGNVKRSNNAHLTE